MNNHTNKELSMDECMEIFKKYDVKLYEYYSKNAWFFGFSARNYAQYLVTKNVTKNVIENVFDFKEGKFMREKNNIKNATFTSVWDGRNGRFEVTTNCKVNMKTHEVFDIEVSDNETIGVLDSEYITIDGIDYAVLNANNEDDIDSSDFWYE